MVFLAAVPDHWCAVPALDNLALSQEQQKQLSIPVEEYDSDGQPVYSSCLMYERNYDTWTTPPPPTPGVNYSTMACQDGWVYSEEIYTSTVVTDVCKLLLI